MKPTIGRIIHYRLNESDKKYLENAFKIQDPNDPSKLIYDGTGRSNNNQDVLPAIITAVWSDTLVNAQVIVDGPTGFMWKTSINMENDQNKEGFWSWPVIYPQVTPAPQG